MNTVELSNTIEYLARACEAVSKMLFEEQQRRLELGEKYADLLTRFNEIIAAQEKFEENNPVICSDKRRN